MAPTHGLKATLSLGSTPIEGTLDSVSMDLAREMAEARHLGDTSVIRLPGLRSCTFTAEGEFDSVIDAKLWTAYNGDTPVKVQFSPDGVTTYTVDVFVSNYSLRAASNAMSRLTVNLTSTGDVARA